MPQVFYRIPLFFIFYYLLRDQFVDHVVYPSLRRELKQLVRRHPDYTLVRREAIRWEREGQPSDTRGRSYSVPSVCAVPCSQTRRGNEGSPYRFQDSLSEIKELLMKQQEQITLLSQNVLQLQNSRPSFNRNSPVICRRCQQPGHVARNCRQLKSRTPGPSSPPSGAGRYSQPMEN